MSDELTPEATPPTTEPLPAEETPPQDNEQAARSFITMLADRLGLAGLVKLITSNATQANRALDTGATGTAAGQAPPPPGMENVVKLLRSGPERTDAAVKQP